MGLNEIVRSKGYKNFMAKLYGIGAAVVILGALFKIIHLPGANEMLILGMGTEAVIFTFSSFEPLHVEYNWALVYPELAMGDDAHDMTHDKKKVNSSLSVTQQLDNMLEEAKIGPELIDSLAKGMKNLGDNANKLSGVSDAAAATDGYVSNLSKAGESVRNLVANYDKTAEALSKDMNISEEYLANVSRAANAVRSLAGVYEETISSIQTDSGSYNTQLKTLSNNLSSINSIYELQLQNSTEYSNLTASVQSQISAVSNNLNETVQGTIKYKEQVEALTKNVAMLNTVYGNMLTAMNVNR
jgi:gliding motility-associated protein GldL